ncbi:acylneuraminate cytidylyltransferase family protein [Thiofaba sp. EF100]|uniref:acylneuraminate cytidylyltransferase family protein n=1 Tax=Thiofaba sp. EF100 TaxID=3121274 RepID=UPI003221F999
MAEADRPNILALIPARGGSKGLPGKNILPLAGKPLIQWSIEAAHGSRFMTRVVVSSDDPAILAVARAAGAETPFVRPAELAQDDTPSMDVVLHALDQLPPVDWVVLLQPTSPLRSAEDIDQAIARCLETGAPACVSVSESPALPWWMFRVDATGRLVPFLDAAQRPQRRQEAPTLYTLNGAVYVARVEWLRKTRSFLSEETVAHVMPAERSVDIDTALDFRLAECLLAAQPEV